MELMTGVMTGGPGELHLFEGSGYDPGYLQR